MKRVWIIALGLGLSSAAPARPSCVNAIVRMWRAAFSDGFDPYELGSGRHRNYDPSTGLYRVRFDRLEGDKLRKFSPDIPGGYFPGSGYVENDTAMSLLDVVTTAKDGRPKWKDHFLEPGTYLYVVTEEGKLIVGRRKPRFPHPSLIGGIDPRVLAAGHLVIGSDLRLLSADNNSGHFSPEASTLDAVLLPLLQRLPSDLLSTEFRFERHERDSEGRPTIVFAPYHF